MRRKRFPALLLVAIALIAVLLWVARPDAAARPPALVATPAPQGHVATILPESPRVRAQATPRADASVAEEIDDAFDPPEEPDGDALFPALDVRVWDSQDAWWGSDSATAYALHAGDSGASGPVASARLGRDGGCTLRLPSHGVYDVGVVQDGEFVWVLQPDVDSRIVSGVILRMPAGEQVRFVADEEFPPARWKLGIAPAEGVVAARTPGRGVVPDIRAEAWAGGALHTRPGVRLRVVHDGGPLVASPQEFTGPAVVTLGSPPRGRFQVHVTAEPKDLTAPCDSFLACEFEVEGGGLTRRWDGLSFLYEVPQGARVSDCVDLTAAQPAPARRSTLRWRGRGVRDGSVDVEVAGNETVTVEVALHLESALPRRPEASLRVLAPAGVPGGELWVINSYGGVCMRLDIAAGAERSVTWLPNEEGLRGVVVGKEHVTHPFALADGGRHDLRLLPSGFVRIVRGVAVPWDVSLTLRRRDGLPMLQGAVADFGGLRLTCALDDPEIVVGPFPEGDVAFVVQYGKIELAEVSAHVVAGKTTDVRLPLADRLSRK